MTIEKKMLHQRRIDVIRKKYKDFFFVEDKKIMMQKRLPLFDASNNTEVYPRAAKDSDFSILSALLEYDEIMPSSTRRTVDALYEILEIQKPKRHNKRRRV